MYVSHHVLHVEDPKPVCPIGKRNILIVALVDSSATPKTTSELSKAEIERRCKRKRKSPMKRVMPKRKSRSRRYKLHSRKKSRRKSVKKSRKSRSRKRRSRKR